MGKVLVIAGGKTGGHLFPGLAVAEAYGGDVVFIGVRGGIEEKVIPKTSFKLVTLPGMGFEGRDALGKLKALALLLYSTFLSYTLLLRIRPRYVLGVGAFSSVPVCLSARILGIPFFIHEQNSIPGKANIFLSRFSKLSFVSFRETLPLLRNSFHTGNPVRETFMRDLSSVRRDKTFSVLFIGGSQGARFINRVAVEFTKRIGGLFRVYHQTGARFYKEVLSLYRGLSGCEVFPFTESVGRYYGRAHLVVSRAGASTVFEVAASGRPAVLIPFPGAVGNHQFYNAKALERLGGAFVLEEKDFSFDNFLHIVKLLSRGGVSRRMGELSTGLFVKDAANRILEAMENA